jgi:hypothetical protein
VASDCTGHIDVQLTWQGTWMLTRKLQVDQLGSDTWHICMDDVAGPYSPYNTWQVQWQGHVTRGRYSGR